MRHRLRALCLAAAIIGHASAHAQTTVEVRSGEHPGFSRLVLEFDALPAWKLDEEPTRLSIAFETDPGRFDLGQVFRFIPRARIAEVRQVGPVLQLELACLCRTQVFPVRGTALVIDVADGPALSEVTAVSNDGGTVSPPVSSIPSGVWVVPLPAQPGAPAADLVPPMPTATRDSPDPAQEPARPELPPLARDAVPRASPDVGPAPSPNGLAAALAREIGRAATFGVVTPGPGGRSLDVPGGDRQPEPELEAPSNLRIRTPGLDLPQGTGADGTPVSPGCPHRRDLDLAAWLPEGTDLGAAIADRRALLVDALDVVDRSAAIDLARLYVAAGFGAEATQVIDRHAGDEPGARLLRDVAQVIDGYRPQLEVLPRIGDCPGRAMLWSFLAQNGDAPHLDDPEMILVALSELPLGLRRHLAPRLADRLLAAGRPDAAENARRLVARAPGPHGAPFDLAAARLDSRVGGGQDALAELALGSSTVSGEALAEFLELMNDRGQPVGARYVELADVQAYAFRNVPLGARLETALIRALLSRDDFRAAFARIERAAREGFIAPATISALSRQFVRDLEARASDEAFVLFGLAYLDGGLPTDLGADTMIRAASRFLEVGLPEPATAFLAHGGGGRAARLVRARHRLAGGAPGDALTLLAGLDDEEAMDLRAAALSALGRHLEAAQIHERRGAGASATDAYWKAGSWSDVAARSDDIRGEAARIVIGPVGPLEPADATEPSATQRERIDAVLQDSSDVRSALDALLATVSGP